MATGLLPFRRPNSVEEKEALEFERPSGLGFPSWLDPVMEKGLAAKPKDRYSSPMELYQAIEVGLSGRV
jgi:hypothetical protein